MSAPRLPCPTCSPPYASPRRSLIAAVVAEWTGASGGLGRTMWLAYTNLNLPYMFAAIFILSIAGVSLYGLIVWLERRVVFWQAVNHF